MKMTLLQQTMRVQKRAWFAVLGVALFILLGQVARRNRQVMTLPE